MTANKELSILKWVGIVLAFLSTLFTLAIVGSHLSGRLAGLGRVGIIGSIGAELMAICCAWLITSERKRVTYTAMICQVILTAVLLANASIASDLDWQETLAGKVVENQLIARKQAAAERRMTLEKQAELALQLLEKDKRLARAFVRAENIPAIETGGIREDAEPNLALLDVRRLSVYERYGFTVMPLFLALLTFIALALAAQSGDASPRRMEESKIPDMTVSIGMGPTAAALDVGSHSMKAKGKIVSTIFDSILPAGADKMKSVNIGRYQFRKDIVGWQCCEIVGRGANRKRPYLAYLSRAAYEAMQMEAPTRDDLEAKLIEWADKKRQEKLQKKRSVPDGSGRFREGGAKILVIPEPLIDIAYRN
jgi:hypothetical protein